MRRSKGILRERKEGRQTLYALAKPDVVWRLLLQTRVQGGLVKALRAAGLINGLDASVEEQTRAFALLEVSFDLTEEGRRAERRRAHPWKRETSEKRHKGQVWIKEVEIRRNGT